MGIEALLSTQIIDTTTVGRAVMTAADAAAALSVIGAVPTSRQLTINGTAYDLSADRSWTVSGGISSLNTLTDATQTFQTGTAGTNFAIVSAAGVHTFNLPDASATNRGLVTTGAQTIAGVKTFSSQIAVSGGSQSTTAISLNSIGFGPFGLSNGWTFTASSAAQVRLSTSGIILQNGKVLGWGNANADSPTTILQEQASHIIAQRNGTNAQTFQIYNTYTSTTSYERLSLGWASNVCTIDTEKGSGGGTLRGLKIGSASSSLIGLYGVTPVVQPTTSVTGATRVGGGGTALTDTDTFDGYTLAQIVKALRNIGALA